MGSASSPPQPTLARTHRQVLLHLNQNAPWADLLNDNVHRLRLSPNQAEHGTSRPFIQITPWTWTRSRPEHIRGTLTPIRHHQTYTAGELPEPRSTSPR